MISFMVRMRFRAEDRDEIAEILRQLAEASRREAGCISYIPLGVEAEPDTVVIFEQYRDEAAREAHRNSSHFQRWAVAGLYQRMLDRAVENLIALV